VHRRWGCLTYHGGAVQYNPHVYLLLWGPAWSSVPSETATAGKMEGLLNGLGMQPEDAWSRVLSGYTNSSSMEFPSFLSPVYMGAWNDTSTPPYNATQAEIAAEADAFASAHGISDRPDAQVVVATQSGTCPQNFFGCWPGAIYPYCVQHSTSTVPYINLPYIFDTTGDDNSCDPTSFEPNGMYDGLTMLLGAEYADTVLDPYPPTGWMDTDASYPLTNSEVADECPYFGRDSNVQLWNGLYALPDLMANDATTTCVASPVAPDQVSVSNPGTQKTVPGSSVSIQVNGSSSGGNQLDWHASDLPPGVTYVDSPTQMRIYGTPAAGTYPVTVGAEDSTGGVATAWFLWTVAPKICPPRVCGGTPGGASPG
jgi:hypothetical protein